MKFFFLTILIILPLPESPGQAHGGSSIVAIDTVRMVFVGDVMGHSVQTNGAWRDGGDSCYNYMPAFQWIKDYIASADIAVANLEVTLAGEPYTGYPRFSSPLSLATALKNTGFDVLTTANNHTLDRGKTGLERTIDILDSIGMPHTGSFKDMAARDTSCPLIIRKNNFIIALLNYTYGTNGLAAEQPNVVNYIDTVQIAADMATAQNMDADYIITCIHWGDEYSTAENTVQHRLAAFLASHGSNLVVGTHPHVVQPVARIAVNAGDTVAVAYSLGNFVSNQRERYRNGGIAMEVTLTKTGHATNVLSLNYEPLWVLRHNTPAGYVFRIIPVNDFIARPERYPQVNGNDKNSIMQFYTDTKTITGM
ncbi:MAG: CapA family protein [Bacteroidales bacterium]|jgi:poly-gamma-glutamate synthesis protein (capsule biosynthesis protein)|nr:CapA family protein [Bacteroidales bacterium]